MAAFTVGTEAVPVTMAGSSRPLIQNLGPGDLYFSRSPAVTTETGIKVEPGQAYEFRSGLTGRLFVIASQADTDVRIVRV